VVDGLDEARWLPCDLFPPAPPSGRLIVLSRRASNDEWIGDLGLEPTAVTRLALGTLEESDVAAVLEAAGGPAAHLAKDGAFVRALRDVAVYEAAGDRLRGDPLYVRLLVEDVRQKRIGSVEQLTRQPVGLKGYFDDWWSQITAALSGAVLRDLLGYLLVAKGPLTRTELAAVDEHDALDEFGREGVAPLDDVLAAARRFLAGDDDAGLSFGHPRFEAYLREGPFKATPTGTYAERLCAYCARWQETHLFGPYALTHYVEHLADRDAGEERRDVLTNARYVSLKLRALGIDALLADYAKSGDALPGETSVASVGRVLRRSRITLAREPDQLAAQLHGRLVGSNDPGIRGMLAALDEVAPPLWLAARTRVLASEQDLDGTLPLVGTVRALAFGTLGGATVLAVGIDDRVVLHDPLRGTSELGTVSNDGCRVTAVCLTTIDGQPAVVAASGYEGRLSVRDPRSDEEIGASVALAAYADTVAVGTLGHRLVIAAAGNGQVWAWDARTREEVEIATEDLRGELLEVATIDRRLTFTVKSVSDTGTPQIGVIDAATLHELSPTFRDIGMEPKAVRVAKLQDGVVLSFLYPPALCGLWSAETGQAIGPYVDMGDAPVRCHALGEIEGRRIVAASLDYAGTGIVHLREAGRRVVSTRRQRPIGAVGDLPIYGLRADDTGSLIALSGLAISLKRVDTEGDQVLTPLEETARDETIAAVLAGSPEVRGFAVREGPRLVHLIDEGELGARHTVTAERFRRDTPLQWRATARAWGALDGRAVLAVGSYGGAAWLWDIADRSLLAGPFADVPDELFVARPELKAARPPEVTSLAIGRSGDREVVATACGGQVQIWDARTSERLDGPRTGDEVVVALELGALAGRDVIVTGSRGGVVRIWDLADAAQLAAITLDSGADGVWVIRDAEAVAALTGDAHLHVLDLRRGDRRTPLEVPAPSPRAGSP
jgi:hypothetical protein